MQLVKTRGKQTRTGTIPGLLTKGDFSGYQVTPEAASVMTELTTSG
jgi:hypothetical protein